VVTAIAAIAPPGEVLLPRLRQTNRLHQGRAPLHRHPPSMTPYPLRAHSCLPRTCPCPFGTSRCPP
jgi:hypothetical protein